MGGCGEKGALRLAATKKIKGKARSQESEGRSQEDKKVGCEKAQKKLATEDIRAQVTRAQGGEGLGVGG